ncbi:MAG: ice-binding family protein [Mycobacteriales bacterium]
MNVAPRTPIQRGAAGFAVGVSVLTGAVLFAFSAPALAATVVPLGTAESFAVLAGTGITNTGPTTINGDIGSFPTPTITGVASITLTGANHGGDAVTQGAQGDLVTAYNNAAGQGPSIAVAADLGGQTLVAGVYNSASSLGLTGDVILNAAGDPNAVFIFQAGSTLTTASSSRVVLSNGAQACNVFWQIGSSATLGTASTMRGTVMALTSISATTGAIVEGRLLARNGAVTLDTNTITRPACVVAPTPSATVSASATTTASATVPPTASASASPTATPSPTASPSATATVAPEATATATTQVEEVPAGGVNTGDGSSRGSGGQVRMLVLLAVAFGGSAAAIAVRRRRRDA